MGGGDISDVIPHYFTMCCAHPPRFYWHLAHGSCHRMFSVIYFDGTLLLT
jgi:hypothetical protein